MHDPTNCFGGVEWATAAHAVAVDAGMRQVATFDIPHTADGLNDLCRRLSEASVQRVAIGRPDGPVAEALLEAHFEVVVVSSRAVKAVRARHGSAGNNCDRADGFALADCLRTEGHRWPLLQHDTHATLTSRSHVGGRNDLIETRVAVANELRAHLWVISPGTIGPFRDIDSPISSRFLKRFPSTTKAAWLSEKRLGTWLPANGYCGRKTPSQPSAPLERSVHRIAGDEGDPKSAVTPRVHRHARATAHPDRCLPGPVPRRRVPRLPRWRPTIDTRIGPPPRRHHPMGRRQQAA